MKINKKRKKTKFEIGQLKRKSKALTLIAEKFRKELIKQQTGAERKFKEYLRLLRIKYEFQKIIYAGQSFFIVDFYLPKYRCCIEIDGGYHNEQKEEDDKRSSYLLMVGVKSVERFFNEEVFNELECIKKLHKIINK
jgi:very-short-patch-repair endonuclease